MDSKFTNPSEDSPGSIDLDFLSASRLAASGRLDEAKALLSPNGVLPATPQALDLLARIAVQTGDFARARKLWQAALQGDPAYEPAIKALDSLDSSWFALAASKRIVFLAFVTIAGSLALVGLLTMFSLLPSPPSQAQTPVANPIGSAPMPASSSEQTKPHEPAASVTANDSANAFKLLKESVELRASQLDEQIQTLKNNQTNILASQNRIEDRATSLLALFEAQATKQQRTQDLIEKEQAETDELAKVYAKSHLQMTNPFVTTQQLPPIEISIDGITVQSQQGIVVIRFDKGLFRWDDNLVLGAKPLLQSVARAIVQTQEKIKIEVVGFADNEPPTWPWQKPKTDEALGQIRADRVKSILESLGIFPVGAISAINGPSSGRPYPGQSLRNRTVVLRISQQ